MSLRRGMLAATLYNPMSWDIMTVNYMALQGVANDNTVYFEGKPTEITGHQLWMALNIWVSGGRLDGTIAKAYWQVLSVMNTAPKIGVNIINPGTLDSIWEGDWDIDDTGYKGNGINTYVHRGVIPFNFFEANNTTIGFYLCDNRDEACFDMGCRGQQGYPSNLGMSALYGLGPTAGISGTGKGYAAAYASYPFNLPWDVTDTRGDHHSTRVSVTDFRVFKNQSQIAFDNTDQSSLDKNELPKTDEFYEGAFNDFGALNRIRTGRYLHHCAYKGLTPAQVLSMQARNATLFTTLGKAVI